MMFPTSDSPSKDSLSLDKGILHYCLRPSIATLHCLPNAVDQPFQGVENETGVSARRFGEPGIVGNSAVNVEGFLAPANGHRG